MFHFRFIAIAALILISPAAFGDPPAKPEVGERIVQGLTATLEVGVPMFNSGDHQGCYRLYLGALTAIKPLLSANADLAHAVQGRMDRAANQTSAAQKAIELRYAIDEIRRAWRKPLWDRLGGETAVTAVVDDVLRAAASDPKVNFLRNGQVKLDGAAANALLRKLVEMISEATGGPLKYSGRDMRADHAGMKMTNEEFDALVGHLTSVLRKYRTQQAEIDELVAIVNQTRKEIVGEGVGSPAGGAPVNPPVPAPPAPMRKSLWERLGNEDAVAKVVHEFVLSGAADPKVNFFRDGQFKLDADGVTRLERKIVEYISSVTGGPLKYTGKDMKAAHAGMKITDEQFNALAGHLVAAMKKFNVPQNEIDDLLAIVATTKKDMVGQ